ncbi:MAG: SDR family oxidoreductase [Verrucomicrobiales bacterium]|nr:SDR family oxidoreductase [Verrucomicrobiales bacterium]
MVEKNMELNLHGKIALITGANNPLGIGAATALRFAEEGAKVALVYKQITREYDTPKARHNGFDKYFKLVSEDAAAVERQLRVLAPDYLIIEKDLTDAAAAVDLFDAVNRRFGVVNILVNNAAVCDESGNDTTLTVTGQVIDDTLSVNVKAALLLAKELARRATNGGRVINLSTDAAQRFAGQITYGASKAALEALTRSMAIEVGKRGITVNAVAPGPTQTGYIDKELERRVLPDIPLGRLGTPADIADAILFLASDRASWITGQVIQVSGGHAI